jgi:folate-binding protein YgfZ
MSVRLADLGVLRFAGVDAISFLQGQLTNDMRRLAQSEPLLAACVSVQGRVVAVLHLLPHSEGILAVLPRELIPGLQERLRRFVLRSKVKIEDLSDEWWVAGLRAPEELAAAALTPPAPRSYLEDSRIGVAAISADRCWVVGPATALEPRGIRNESEEHALAWRLADIRDGLPQIHAATSEMFIAQMLNLDLIDAISFSKGCYTGQEIIARTQHRGRIKRRMFRLALPRTLEIGAPLALEDGRAGRVVDCVSLDGRCEALAVLSLAPGTVEAGDPEGSSPESPTARLAATELPLPYALDAE